MAEWYDFDEDFWDEYYGAEDEMNMQAVSSHPDGHHRFPFVVVVLQRSGQADLLPPTSTLIPSKTTSPPSLCHRLSFNLYQQASLANDLAESTVPDINWSIFDENPTSRDLQPFDWEGDWILFEFDHDEYYDTRSSSTTSIRPKSYSPSSISPFPFLPTMDEESATQQQFHHDPVAVSAKNAAAITAPDSPMTDDVDDSLDGGLRKKRPDIQISQQSSTSSSDKNKNAGQSPDRSGSAGTRSRRSRTPVPNPNTGPQPGEVLEVLHEDHEKKVVIVHTGGVLGKLRVIRKDTVQPPAAAAGPGPSPLRNALDASQPSSNSGTVSLIVDAPTPK
ncbi:hypothetical protein TWF481_004832 [Arthrobotrys musiformis]|uniref:KOW domain-containing protein n=1 Tax=Arthrobotrys musiformis TaxID=47236 RepID=A0AAV9WLW0_9PEZI